MSTGFLQRKELASQTTLLQEADAGGSQRHTPGRSGQQADYDTFLKLPASNGKRRRRAGIEAAKSQGLGHSGQADEAAAGVLLKFSQ
jgi:hypothetical protein